MKKISFLIALVFATLLIVWFVAFKSGGTRQTADNTEDNKPKLDFEKTTSADRESKRSSNEKIPPHPSQALTDSKSEPSDKPASNNKFKRMSVEEEISKVEQTYPAILNRKGFTEHEVEVIVGFQIEEIKSTTKLEESAIDKASRELAFSKEKKNLLNEAFDETFLGGLVQFTTDDVAACLSKRLTGISECTKSVLDDYLRDLPLALESDVFVINSKVGELTRAATKKAIETCKETPERANYQFRLVFVECDPI